MSNDAVPEAVPAPDPERGISVIAVYEAVCGTCGRQMEPTEYAFRKRGSKGIWCVPCGVPKEV